MTLASTPMRHIIAITLLPAAMTGAALRAHSPDVRPMAVANDYQRSSGVVRNGVLTVRLVAQRAQWRPADERGVALPADAFGEEGKAPSVPGPMLRAKVGTRVEASIRNALPETLVVHGLREHGPGSGDAAVTIPPGQTRPVRFTINATGAYVYFGVLLGGGAPVEGGHGTQLTGVIIGDTANTPPPERVMVVSFWNRLIDSTAKEPDERILFLLNGKIWPYTPRFTYTVGDTVRWRLVDVSYSEHPMHLHGFYFRVDSRGSAELDSIYDADHRRTVVTENLQQFGSFTLTWVPERAGNWIFHCHKPAHTSYQLRYTLDNVDPPPGPQQVRHDVSHAVDGMSGLVVGVTVQPRGPSLTAASTAPATHVRVLVQERAGFYGTREGLGYVIPNGTLEPARDSIQIPGAPIVVTRGVPAEITVVNRTSNATAVHWHGIELESFYDGVAGWSGAGNRTAPMIPPNDSFIVRFTPPRAGTFIYHSHTDDIRQIGRGLYAPLIVLEPGERWDPLRDHVLMIGGAYDPKYAVVLNGSRSPKPLVLTPGVRHRLRVINMTIDEEANLSWRTSADTTDSAVVSWRAIAKDGAALPDRMATVRPATLHIAPGETYDFEMVPSAGETRIDVESVNPSRMRVIASAGGPIMGVFAHPDDERIIGPLLSRLAREGRETHLVIATDGSQGVTDFARIPAGAPLAAARAQEARCAAARLGIRQLHMLGLLDGGLASFDALGKLRSQLAAVVDSVKPAAIITFGPEGGTGHPDHRLVGDVMSQIIQGDARYANIELLYASLPSERLKTAPPAQPTVNGMAEALLTVRVPFEDRDLTAGREEFSCHKSQYTPAQMDAVNKYLAHAWNGTVWLRPWTGNLRDANLFAR